MATKKSTSGQGAKKHAPANTTLRKQQQERDAERPSRHSCCACGEGILVKDLQMVVHAQAGGHKVKQPHHKKCCFQFK
jgi:hypothetical protein